MSDFESYELKGEFKEIADIQMEREAALFALPNVQDTKSAKGLIQVIPASLFLCHKNWIKNCLPPRNGSINLGLENSKPTWSNPA